jgi:hypothetical protein
MTSRGISFVGQSVGHRRDACGTQAGVERDHKGYPTDAPVWRPLAIPSITRISTEFQVLV